MLKKTICFCLLWGVTALAMADTVEIKSDHPQNYVVQKGDTLWDISGRFLQKPWLWPEVWQANPQIENPHLIYPGDVVSLTYKDGRPILSLSRSGKDKSGRYVKLSPSMRSYEKEKAIPAIPIDAIKPFLNRPLVVGEDTMIDWPYVVSSYEEHLVAGAGNKIYVRGIPEDATDKRYAIYRRGKAYINSRIDKDAVLGYEALYVGDAVLDSKGDPASLIIAKSNREVLNGDRLVVESEEEVSTDFIPTIPAQEINANVISVIDGVSEIGQYQIVVVDAGTGQGLEVGNVLGIYQSGKVVKDQTATEIKAREEDAKSFKFGDEESFVDRGVTAVGDLARHAKRTFDKTDFVGYLGRPNSEPVEVELPAEYAGVMMVFRTFDNLSYALVMEAAGAIHVHDTVKNL